MNPAVFGLIGVLLGASISIAKDLVTHWIGRRRRGRYAAVRIVCVLDQYAENCVEVVADDGTIYGMPAGRSPSGEDYYEAQVASPPAPVFPADIDWTSIQPALMYRILSLPNIALETDRYIAAQAEHAYPPDYGEFFEARWEGYAKLGLEALSIADELRREFGLPKMSISMGNTDWDSEEVLKGKIDKIETRRAIQREKSEARLTESANAAETHG